MLKDKLAALIGKENYVKYIMFLTKTYHAFRAFRHPETRLIQQLLLPRGGTALDIGANIGQFTGMAAKVVGKSGRVFSFEPVPLVLGPLRAMVRLRGLRQVTICEMALGNENGEADISIPLKDGWKPLVPVARVSGEAEPGTLRLKIQVRRLDDVCKEKSIDRVDFIKCDTEGFEFSVFSGGLHCLSQNLPCVICEIYEEYLARRNRKPAEVFEIFRTLGYRAYRINPEGLLVPVEGYQNPTDYLFIHPSRFDRETLRPFTENPPRAF